MAVTLGGYTYPMGTINVLFVDDDQTIATLANAIFSRHGFRVLAALNTTQADRILDSERVDLIVCDVLMPKEDGIQFCTRLRSAGKRIPLLFLSTLSHSADVTRGLAAGASDYLAKPFDPIELIKRMFMAVKSAQPSPQPKTTLPTPPAIHWMNRLTQGLRSNLS